MATGAGERPADGEGAEPGRPEATEVTEVTESTEAERHGRAASGPPDVARHRGKGQGAAKSLPSVASVSSVAGRAPDAGDWEDVLSLRVENGAPDEAAKPRVRLSSLRPPAQPGGAPQAPTAPLPLRPGEPWHASGETLSDRQTDRQREMERDELLEREKGALRRLSESEHAHRAAEARVAELERELADLHAQMAYERDAARQAIAAGGNGADLERLRTELAAAQEIIRAIEEAYLAGEGFARGGPST